MTKKLTLNDVAASIDELALMVKEGFDDVYRRFDYIYKTMTTKEDAGAEFKKIHRRFDELEEGKRRQEKEAEVCRHHRALTDTRLSQLESTHS